MRRSVQRIDPARKSPTPVPKVALRGHSRRQRLPNGCRRNSRCPAIPVAVHWRGTAPGWRLLQIAYTGQTILSVFNTHAPPNVLCFGCEAKAAGKQACHARVPLGEHLLRVPFSPDHDARNGFDVIVRHTILEEVAHGINEHHFGRHPAQRLCELSRELGANRNLARTGGPGRRGIFQRTFRHSSVCNRGLPSCNLALDSRLRQSIRWCCSHSYGLHYLTGFLWEDYPDPVAKRPFSSLVSGRKSLNYLLLFQ